MNLGERQGVPDRAAVRWLERERLEKGVAMKSLVPWFCLVAIGSQSVFAEKGIIAYREGNYSLAGQLLLNQSQHDPIVEYYLGRMRLYGYGELKNNEMAIRYFNQAGEKGVLSAQWLLARYYLFAQKSPEKALYWFKKAAQAGNIPSQLYCAGAYLWGFGVAKNEDSARRYYIDAAKSGNALAQYALGMQFLDSRDQRNRKLGVIWLTKAAAQGQIKAQLKLAELYTTGTLVSVDLVKAQELLEKLAAQNNLSAMLALGEIALKQGNEAAAENWFTKVATAQDPRGEYALGRLYQDPHAKVYDLKRAFMWMLQAGQNKYPEAQQALSLMYKQGIGIAANQNLAQEWEKKAKQSLAKQNEIPAIEKMAKWLTEDQSNTLFKTVYYLGGIFNGWHNPNALKQNIYNQSPKMGVVTRSELYQPKFVMVKPNDIAINDYLDHLVSALSTEQASTFSFPHYLLNQHIETLRQSESLVLQHSSRKSMVDEGLPYIGKPSESLSSNYIKKHSHGWQYKANYQAVLNQLYNQAILGNPAAQFELGQLYHYGIGVNKNPLQALTYYQLAATQQDIRAEYNLGLLYLEGQITPLDYQKGVNWLLDAAFKGNVYSQFVLAHFYKHGLSDPTGAVIIQPNAQQANAMLYLASANHFGPAEYQLAQYLSEQHQAGLSVLAKQNRAMLVKRLYQEAVAQGIVEANLPLAFYNAMDSDPVKQKEAFSVAQNEAQAGNSNAALLVGILFDRGIGTPVNQQEAINWYQKATINPVNAFILGTYYSQGIGLKKDLEKGNRLLEQAAQADFSYANLNLAILKHQMKQSFLQELDKARALDNSTAGLLLADYYLAMANDPEKMQQARAIYQFFAEKGDQNAQLKLGYLYHKGLGGIVDLNTAAQWYLAAAEQGQPIAQYLLGQLYQLGLVGLSPDYALAKQWYQRSQNAYPKASIALGFVYDTVDDNYQKAFENYQKAAQSNNPIAQFNLGLIYEYGKGQPADYRKARALYTQAATAGNAYAMTQLAGLYFLGQGGERDSNQALSWYKKAAALNNSEALYQLGLFSETGVATTPINFINAIRYYEEASKNNDKAKLALARIYQFGLGQEKDNQQAATLYKELADKQNAFAQYQLALMYLDGSAGMRNISLAKQLLGQASLNGSVQARNRLQWLEAQEQGRVSFIEPILIDNMPRVAGQSADLMYFNALSEWNRGNDAISRFILDRLMNQFPHFNPAKRAYEQLNKSRSSLS